MIKRFFREDFLHPELGCSVKYDTFIHTWDESHFRYNTTTWEADIVKLSAKDVEDMKAIFEPKHMEVESFQLFKSRTGTTRNFDPMFYSFMKSVHYKRLYELKHDFEYDMVIKVRLDTIYGNPANNFILHKIDPLVAYTCTPVSKFIYEFHYNNFDDVFYYADSKTMDLLADTYRIHNQKRQKEQEYTDNFDNEPEFYYGPGCLLYKTMVDLSIHPFCWNSFPWYVVRRNVAESNLDPIKDWPKVVDMCMNWYRQ